MLKALVLPVGIFVCTTPRNYSLSLCI